MGRIYELQKYFVQGLVPLAPESAVFEALELERHRQASFRIQQYHLTNTLSVSPSTPRHAAIMSMFGLGRPQPSSAEKIASAEQEMDLVTDMFNKSVSPISFYPHKLLSHGHRTSWSLFLTFVPDSNKPA